MYCTIQQIDAPDFFEAVKNTKEDSIKVVENYLTYFPHLLFEYDYFGQTAYHWAAKRNNYAMMRVLIIFGRHLNFYDFNKRTPLFLAALNNHKEVASLLLEKGANPFFANKDNLKPVDVAKNESIKELIQLYMDNVNIYYKLRNASI